MPIKLTIVCDTPENERAPVWQDESIRCYSDFNKNIHGVVYGAQGMPGRLPGDLRALALFQGWKINGQRLICPACARRLER